MSFKVHSVVNANTPAGEIVWLNSTSLLSLNGYAVVDRTFDSTGKISNEFRHIFIFPDINVGTLDWVALHSGQGKYHTTPTKEKIGVIHHFYWQSDECVWNNNGQDTATLIKYEVINSVAVPKV